MLNVRSHSSRLLVTMLPPPLIPALLNNKWILSVWCRSATSSRNRSTCVRSATSAMCVVTRSPCGNPTASHSPCVSAWPVGETSHIATLQASATNWRTSSRPMPLPPPVTTAVLPANSVMCVPLAWESVSSALDRRAVAGPGFDRMHIGGALEGLGCRLARPAGPADRRKEVVQPGRQIGPGHFELPRSIIDDLVFDPGAGINGGARNERVRHPVDQDRAFPFKAEQVLLIRGVTVLANVAPWRNDLDPHRQIVGTAMLGAKFDDRIAIRPNRLPIGLALFGLQYNPCPFRHTHDDLPLRRFPAKFLAGRLSGQSVFTAFRVPMRVNSLCYGSGTDGSQTRRRGELDSRRGPCHGDFAG